MKDTVLCSEPLRYPEKIYKHFGKYIFILDMTLKMEATEFYVWFHASLIYINNCPTRCITEQSIYYSASSLYIFPVSTTPIIRSSQNCNYSLRYWSYFLCICLPPTWPGLTTLEGGGCTVPEAVVTVLCTPDDGCSWHQKHVEWTCTTINGLLCLASRWTIINIGVYRFFRNICRFVLYSQISHMIYWFL